MNPRRSLTRATSRPILRPLVRSLFARGGGGMDATTLDWAARVTANGGTYSVSTLIAVDTFVRSAKANGYWTKLNRINLFCGDQLAAALVPLKVGGGSATETNVNFVAGDYTEATGLTGNGSTKYLNTGLVPSVSLTLNDTHLAVYNRAGSAVGGSIQIGARDGTNFLEMLAPNSDGIFYSRAYDVNAIQSGAAISAPYGSMVASRTAAASFVEYQQAVSKASSATSAGALVAQAVYVFATNSSGTANFFVSHPLASYSIGSGLTAGDVTAYNTDMQAFQTALGRNV